MFISSSKTIIYQHKLETHFNIDMDKIDHFFSSKLLCWFQSAVVQ